MDYKVLDTIKENKGINKSSLFLLPLLGLSKEIKPLNTYLGFEGFQEEFDCCLILLFSHHQKEYKKWDKELREHKLYDFSIEESKDYVFHVYNLYAIDEDYQKIKMGKYSEISPKLKTILNMIGSPLVHIGLNPELFYKQLANELNTYEEDIINNVEIVTRPDELNEYIHVSDSIKKSILACI